MREGLKLARKIGANPALAQFVELEIVPGAAVEDDQLADVIVSNLASHGHLNRDGADGRSPGPAWRPPGDRRTSCRRPSRSR